MTEHPKTVLLASIAARLRGSDPCPPCPKCGNLVTDIHHGTSLSIPTGRVPDIRVCYSCDWSLDLRTPDGAA